MMEKLFLTFLAIVAVCSKTSSAEPAPLIYCLDLPGFDVDVDGRRVNYTHVDISFKYDTDNFIAYEYPYSSLINLVVKDAGFIFRGDADYNPKELSVPGSKYFAAKIIGVANTVKHDSGRHLIGRNCAFDVKEVPSNNGVNVPKSVKKEIYSAFARCLSRQICSELRVDNDAFVRGKENPLI